MLLTTDFQDLRDIYLNTELTEFSVLYEFSVFKKSLCLCASACLNYNMEISLRRMSLCNLLLSWQFTFLKIGASLLEAFKKIIHDGQKIYSRKLYF